MLNCNTVKSINVNKLQTLQGSPSEQDDEDIISIGDSSNDNNSSDSIELDEEIVPGPETETREELPEAPAKDMETSKPETSEQSVDPMNQGQVSLLTDDNSYVSDNEISLNYSDEKNTDEKENVESGNFFFSDSYNVHQSYKILF